MDEQPPPEDADAPRLRRRVIPSDTESGREGRNGCLLIGAVLGIVLGALFAFFGLPPLINHFFAEEQVPAGQWYSADGRIIRAVSIGEAPSSPPQVLIELEMTVNTTWTPKTTNFTLEYSSGGSWSKATAAQDVTDGANPRPLDFDVAHLGKVTKVYVTFPAEPDRGTPRYIHLGDPHIRLELPSGTLPR